MSETYYLHLEKLEAGYSGKAVVKEVTVGLGKGRILTLIGPNGAGKSTILRTITRQLQSIAGTIEVGGKSIRGYSGNDLAKTMSVVLTERIHPERMTCRDVVAMGRYPYTGRMGRLEPEDEAKVDAAMARVQIEAIGERNFENISDGQRQRVMLARAICQDPEIIVLDEPTSFLDVKHKLELLAILKDMSRQDRITVVMSLHEIDLAMKISDEICCVSGDGRIEYCGGPEGLLGEDTVSRLFSITEGSFDPLLGSTELSAPKGRPKVLVLSSGGSGIPVFRRLQRDNVPFAAAILYKNDIDWRVANRLASAVVEEKPFEPISEEHLRAARKLVDQCCAVIDAGVTIGSVNGKMQQLLEYAAGQGKLVKDYESAKKKLAGPESSV